MEKNEVMREYKENGIVKFLIKRFYMVLLIPMFLIAVHYNFYFSTASLVKAKQSINPKATSYFIHANVISTFWIDKIHTYLFIDYDSTLMKPLLNFTQYLFVKGEANIKQNNAEDGVWWFLTYAYIYNFNTASRKDDSMDIYNLPKKEEMSLRYKLADYIIKLGNKGVKGVEFGKYESSAMHTMFAINFSKINIDKHYEGKRKIDRVNAYWKDSKLYNYKVKTYKSYKKFRNKDLYLNEWELYSLDSLNNRLWFLVVKDIKSGIKMTNCKNEYISNYLDVLEKLFKIFDKKSTSIPDKKVQDDFSHLIKTNRTVLNVLESSCQEYELKIKNFKQNYMRSK
jgi:hypothetical protein